MIDGLRAVSAVAVALVLLTACSSGPPDQSDTFSFVAPGGKVLINYPVGQRSLPVRLTGEDLHDPAARIDTGAYAGKVLVINLWASWCGPCRAEIPDLQTLQDRLAGSDVQVIGIDVRDDRQNAQDFVNSVDPQLVSIFDNPGRTLATLHGYPRNAVPSTIVLDRSHRVATVSLVQIRLSEFIPIVKAVAAEKL